MWQAWTDLRSFTIAAESRDLHRDLVRRAQLKSEVVWEIERGLAMTAMDVHEASLKRSDCSRVASTLFESCDVLALPSAQVWPFPVEMHWPGEIAGQKMDTYHRWMEVVIGGTMAGIPVVSVPAGFDEQGRPMGLQAMLPFGADKAALEFAAAFERVTDHLNRAIEFVDAAS